MNLVLLPGMDGTGMLFQPFLRTLGGTHPADVVAYPSDRPTTYADQESFVEARLPRDKDFVLVAESYSGPLALNIARHDPPGLRGVVLCASFVTNPLRIVPRWLADKLAFVCLRITPRFVVGQMLLGRMANAELRRSLNLALDRVPLEVLASRTRNVLYVDARDSLAHCPCPVMVIRGTLDRVVGPASLREITAIAPNVVVNSLVAPT